MITVEHGEYRFFSGDNIAYHNATPEWLFDQAGYAEDQAFRCYAAAGLMRAVLDCPLDERVSSDFYSAMNWAQGVIMDVQAEAPPTPADRGVRGFMDAQKLVNGVIDATSIAATWANTPEVTAAFIDKYVPTEKPKLVIGIGHSGILSSLATYSALKGDSIYYAFRFSQHKSNDDEPQLAKVEKDILAELIKDRAVIIHDEDRSLDGDGTMRAALSYMNRTFDIAGIGIVPVLARHPSTMWPEVRTISRHGEMETDTYAWWSDEFKAIVEACDAEDEVSV